jgi:hypothetical protein
MKRSAERDWICCLAMRLLGFLVHFTMFTACNAQVGKSEQDSLKERYFLLGLIGYNYTDRHISDYTVGGAGGSPVMLSSPTSGGSGITCCLRLSKKSTGPIRVKVRWQLDGCTYLLRNERTGAVAELRHFYYKEADVDVLRIGGGAPGYIETHFYPEGSVQVRLTDHFSSPLLKLDPKRTDKSSFPKCKDDEKPEK